MVAHAMQNGREPRTLTDDLIRLLRDCFLTLMAPELVQLPSTRQAEVSELAQRLGASGFDANGAVNADPFGTGVAAQSTFVAPGAPRALLVSLKYTF